MSNNIITYAYRGLLSTIYFITGQKERIKELFEEKDNRKNNKNNVFNKAKSLENDKNIKKHYRYKAIDKDGKLINGTFDAFTMTQAKKYLESTGLTVKSIKEREGLDIDIQLGRPLSYSKLSFDLTQISTYLKSGLTLVEGVKLLAKQEKKREKKKIYDMIVCDLLAGDDLSRALNRQKNVFPAILINMTRSAELTGDLPNVLDEMAEYFSSIDKTRKEIKSAMTYPTLVFIFSIIVVTFVLVWVVPQYQAMFASFSSELPKITKITIGVSNFIRENAITILLVLIMILSIYLYLFKKVRGFRRAIQTFYLHVPILRKVIMYSEVSMFARTFASLINHGVHITDSMDVLLNVSDNEVYRDLIIDTVNNVNAGGKISDAFKDHFAFPAVAYEMIVTGEDTGSLGVMMDKVADYYDNLHKNTVSSLKSLIEPMLIIFLSFVVGLIILSIILPMFEMYRIIN